MALENENDKKPEEKPFRLELREEDLFPTAPLGENDDADAAPAAAPENASAAGPTPQTAERPAPVKKRKKRRHSPLGAIINIVVILAFVAFFSTFIISFFVDMTKISVHDAKTAIVTVKKGDTATNVAAALKSKGMLSNDWAFRLYVKLQKNIVFQPGDFLIKSDMDYEHILAALTSKTQNLSIVDVTIKEGMTLAQIADLVSSDEKSICARADFISAAENYDFKFKYLNDIPKTKGRYYRLEGYLFPDTYSFYKGTAPEDVVQLILTTFEKRFTADMQTQLQSSGMTLDQVITLASIIQSEAGKPSDADPNEPSDDQRHVSSVFHNRLTKGEGSTKMLQSDATLLYIYARIGSTTTKLSEVDSPYNTYKNVGLPAGPICNPGTAAIKAALNPSESGYFYFVSDSNGKYYYAATFAQHQKNVKTAAKVGKGTVTGTETQSGS